jgi:hypothetical protein
MQDDNDSPATEPVEEAPKVEEEPTTIEEEARTPRSAEPTPVEEPPKEPDTIKTLQEENAKLKEQVSEISDQITRLQEPKPQEPKPGEEDLLTGILYEDGWQPKKATYHEFGNDVIKRSAEVARRVIADEVRKAQEVSSEEEKEATEVRATFQKGVDRLRSEGKIPLVRDFEDPNDAGMKAEEAMKKLAIRYNTLDLQSVYNDIYSKNIQVKKPMNPLISPQKGQPNVGKAINYQKEVAGKRLSDILAESEGEE